LFVFDILQILGGCKISKTLYGPAKRVAEHTRKKLLISYLESEGRKGPDEVVACC